MLSKRSHVASFAAQAFLLVGVVLAGAGESSAGYPGPLDAAANPAIAPYAGYVNHAHLAPNFRWGWFGAERYHPRVAWHRDYNGDLLRWAKHRRY